MVSGVTSGSISNYYQYVNNSGDKIEVPVPSSISVYAQFEHVRGVPAEANQQTISLTRAQIINNMVSYLNSSPEDYSLESGGDYTLQELETEVHRLVNEEAVNFNTLSGQSADTGIIFNLTA